MSLHDELLEALKRLRLPAVSESLEPRLRQAREQKLSHAEFLYRLLTDEVSRRERRQLELRLRRARFDQEKVLEEYDFGFNPLVPRERVLELASCRFVVERRNVVLTGPTGVGKSHLAQALGHQACRAGYTVRYTGARELLTELRASRADDSFEATLRRYVKPQLLIVDDLGLRPLRGEEPHDLYEVIRRRYERAATIWTSNRELEEWASLFGEPLLGNAALDRLLHATEVLELVGDTFRNPPPDKRRQAGESAGQGTGDELGGEQDEDDDDEANEGGES